MIYIYKITNNLNKRCYIGQSIHPELRWKRHIQTNKSLISKALHHFGLNNFDFEIIHKCKLQSKADLKEKFYIDHFDSFKNGYNKINKAFGVMRGHIPWNKGRKIGPNLKARESIKGRIPWNKGKQGQIPSIETRHKLSLSSKKARKAKFWSTKRKSTN